MYIYKSSSTHSTEKKKTVFKIDPLAFFFQKSAKSPSPKTNKIWFLKKLAVKNLNEGRATSSSNHHGFILGQVYHENLRGPPPQCQEKKTSLKKPLWKPNCFLVPAVGRLYSNWWQRWWRPRWWKSNTETAGKNTNAGKGGSVWKHLYLHVYVPSGTNLEHCDCIQRDSDSLTS